MLAKKDVPANMRLVKKSLKVVGSRLEIRETRRNKNENYAQNNEALNGRLRGIWRDKER